MSSGSLAIVGAGPAGSAAALEAAASGLEVHLFDRFEIDIPAAPRLAVYPHTPVWGLFPGWQVCAASGDHPVALTVDSVLLTTGAIDLVVPCEGGTLPGMMAARGLARLIEHWRLLPGQRFVVIGSGEESRWISDVILSAGGDVVLTLDHEAARSSRIVGDDGVTGVRVGNETIATDIVVIAAGSIPDLALAAMAGCEMIFDDARQLWRLAVTETRRSSVPGIWAAGFLADPDSDPTASGRDAARAICSTSDGLALHDDGLGNWNATSRTSQPWKPDSRISRENSP